MTNEAKRLVEVDLNMPREDVLPFVTSRTLEECIEIAEHLKHVADNANVLRTLLKIQALKLSIDHDFTTHSMPETVQ
jgi:antitoxin component HigA of HigAB toxin-antitoxin module